MTNNALADEKGGFNGGILTQPTVLNVTDAYTLLNNANTQKDGLNYVVLNSFEKGILTAILTEQELNGISDKERKELLDCLIFRPLSVFENALFRKYEENDLSGEALYGEVFYALAKNQCVK